jgi:filamentous hemagglutinin family protein
MARGAHGARRVVGRAGRWCGRRAVAAAAAAVALWVARPAAGQIVADGTTGDTPAGFTFQGPNYGFGIGDGLQRGPNLYFSFGRFNLNAGESAVFSNGDASVPISRMIVRVTGGERSFINGPVTTDAPVDFYFINRSGILVGPQGSFAMAGSVFLSTADYLKFDNGEVMFADARSGSVFSSAAPAAFGFLPETARPESIDVQGDSASPTILHTPATPGQRFAAVGGGVRISGRFVSQAGGAIQIVSTARTEVPLATVGNTATPADPTTPAAGSPPVTLPDLSAAPAEGDVTIEGTQLSGGNGGGIQVHGGKVLIDRSSLDVMAGGVDSAGVSLSGGDFTVASSSVRSRGTFPGGVAGDIAVNAASLLLRGGAGAAELLGSNEGPGTGANIRVDVGTLRMEPTSSVRTFATVDSSARGGSTGGAVPGDIKIRAADRITVDGGGLAAFTEITSTGVAGTGGTGAIDIDARGTLELLGGGRIGSFADGGGAARPVTVNAGTLAISGMAGPDHSVIASHTGGTDADVGAAVSVTAGLVVLTDGGRIQTDTTSAARGGDVTVRVGRLRIAGTGSATSGVSSDAIGAGRAGDVLVEAGRIEMFGSGAQPDPLAQPPAVIGSDSAGAGSGAVTVRTGAVDPLAPLTSVPTRGSDPFASPLDGSVVLREGAVIGSRSTTAGPAGEVRTAIAGQLWMDGGSVIGSFAQQGGPAGVVTVAAGGDATLLGDAALDVRTSSGDAEASLLIGGDVAIGGGAAVRVTSPSRDALATVDAGGLLSLDNAKVLATAKRFGRVTLKSGRSTIAAGGTDAQANGADAAVTLDVGGDFNVTSARFAATAGGDGGRVRVDVDGNGSWGGATLAATAGGSGGDVDVNVDGDLTIAGSAITADAPNGGGGSMSVDAGGTLELVGDSRMSARAGGEGANVMLKGDVINADDFSLLASAGSSSDSARVTLAGEARVMLYCGTSIEAIAAGAKVPLVIPNPALIVEDCVTIIADVVPVTTKTQRPKVLEAELPPPPQIVPDVARKLMPLCGMRVLEVSSFVTNGRGGTMPVAGGFMPTPDGATTAVARAGDKRDGPGPRRTDQPVESVQNETRETAP